MQLPEYVDSQYHLFLIKHSTNYNYSQDLFPFTTINNFMLYPLLSNKKYCDNDLNDSCPASKPLKNLPHLFNEFSSFSSDISNTPEHMITWY